MPHTNRLTRRRAMTGALAAATGIAFAAPAHAQGVHGFRRQMQKYKEKKRNDPHRKGWLESVMPRRGEDGALDASASSTPTLLTSASSAVESGTQAREYCQTALARGDASFAPALQAIQAMLPVANALAKLSEVNALRLKDFARTANTFLADCEAACRPLGASHAPCRACADACAAAIRECRTIIGA